MTAVDLESNGFLLLEDGTPLLLDVFAGITPPTRVSYNVPTSGNYSTATSPKSTNTFDIVAGDKIIVIASVENASSQGAGAGPAYKVSGTPAGSITWTLLASQNAGNTNQSAAYMWEGDVGAGATGGLLEMPRPTGGTGLFWGFSGTLWRDHGGIGAIFSGSNGTGSSAPADAQTCAANSAVQFGVNDWNSIDGASRTFLSINGSPESESLYFRDPAIHAVYGGYRLDTGAAGSITQGLSAPSTMRWVLVGAEILGL